MAFHDREPPGDHARQRGGQCGTGTRGLGLDAVAVRTAFGLVPFQVPGIPEGPAGPRIESPTGAPGRVEGRGLDQACELEPRRWDVGGPARGRGNDDGQRHQPSRDPGSAHDVAPRTESPDSSRAVAYAQPCLRMIHAPDRALTVVDPALRKEGCGTIAMMQVDRETRRYFVSSA